MTTAKQKARLRAVQREEGGRQISAQFNAAEIALLEKVKRGHPNLSQKEILVAGLHALYKSRINRTQVLAYLEKHLT